MRIAINSDAVAVAVIEYNGPLPRKGDYISVPGSGDGDLVIRDLHAVRYVVWHVLEEKPGTDGLYAPKAEPFIEVMVA